LGKIAPPGARPSTATTGGIDTISRNLQDDLSPVRCAGGTIAIASGPASRGRRKKKGRKPMRKNLLVAAGLVSALASMSASPAWAAWGCRATDAARYNWYSWASADERSARKFTLETLCGAAKHGGCRIVECRSGVDTQAQADALWDLGTPKTGCQGAAKC